ncbi:MAG: sensor histidine kinase, partial [Telluria sp.]
MPARSPLPHSLTNALTGLHRAFDATATWVTQLSWWKFFLFAALSLIAATIVQDELFSGGGEVVTVSSDSTPRKRDASDAHIVIDDTGIRFNPRKNKRVPEPPVPPAPPEA